jgi:hypothetical protein
MPSYIRKPTKETGVTLKEDSRDDMTGKHGSFGKCRAGDDGHDCCSAQRSVGYLPKICGWNPSESHLKSKAVMVDPLKNTIRKYKTRQASES